MSDRGNADMLAEQIVKGQCENPTPALKLLAEQLLRRRAVIERLEDRFSEMGTLDLIHANRDTILRITEEGVKKLKFHAEYIWGTLSNTSGPIPPIVTNDLRDHAKLMLDIIEAINTFHPMHAESWSGWPNDTNSGET